MPCPSNSPADAFACTTVQPSRIEPLFTLFNQQSSLTDFFQALFYTAIAVGATLAVFRLGYAGFLYMGSDIWSSQEKARQIMRDVVMGLLLLLAVYVILNQINPDILNLDILRSVQTEQSSVPTGNNAPASSPFPTSNSPTSAPNPTDSTFNFTP